MVDPLIPAEDIVVHDDALGIDRQLKAGQPVPPDLIDAYQKATGRTAESKGKSSRAAGAEEITARGSRSSSGAKRRITAG